MNIGVTATTDPMGEDPGDRRGIGTPAQGDADAAVILSWREWVALHGAAAEDEAA